MGARWRSARWRRAGLLAGAMLVWILLGLRTIGSERFGVLRLAVHPSSTWLVQGRVALAPLGLLRLQTYPRHGVELALPDAEAAQLPSADGGRFGFRGWVTVRPRIEDWRALDRAAADGLEGALVAAVRAAGERLRPGSERGADVSGLRRDLERELSAALAERGLDLRRLEVDAVDHLAVAEGSRSDPTTTKLLVIGLDGLDWEIVEPLLAAGRLPNLAGLIERGTRAKLLSISPLLSPVIWTTVATGVEPSRHGILDFLVEDSQGGARQPVTSVQRRRPTVWELLSREGVEVGVTAWWASWPADSVRGYLVSDRISYQLFGYRADPEDARGKTWPPGLYETIRPMIVAPDRVDWSEVAAYLDGPARGESDFSGPERELLRDFRTLLASRRTYLDIAQQLRRRFRPQLECVYFEGTDTVGHLFMSYRPPPLPGVDLRRQQSFGRIVDRYYETADRDLGALLADRGEGWTVLVLSDHGFASDATRPRTTDSRIGHGVAADWHRRFGVLVLSGAHVRHGAQLEEASVYDIAPTILALFGQPIPRSWPGRVLAPALEPAFLEAHPVRYRPDDPGREDLRAEALSDPAAADLLQKLESLGYVSSGGGGGGGSSTARNNAGVALLAEGRYAEAEQEFRQGLRDTPDSPMLRVNLGLALRLQGRLPEAAEQLAPAARWPATQRSAGLLLAQIRIEQDDLGAAEGLLREILVRETDAADVRTTLGQVLERRGDLAGAEREFTRAAELDPDAALPRNHLGSLYRRRGQLELAERWYRAAIEADPYFMGAYNNLALVYQDLGRMAEARDLYARALTKAPDHAEVLNNLGSWYYARGQFEEAKDYWLRASAANPAYPSPWNNLAGLEITAQRLDEAERLLGRALELDPGYGDARINLALVLRQRGKLDEARAELTRATEDERTGATAWIKLGGLDLEAGRVQEAVEHLERGRRIAPKSTELLNYLGEAYRRQGRDADALAMWQRSLAIDPGQSRLREHMQANLARKP